MQKKGVPPFFRFGRPLSFPFFFRAETHVFVLFFFRVSAFMVRAEGRRKRRVCCFCDRSLAVLESLKVTISPVSPENLKNQEELSRNSGTAPLYQSCSFQVFLKGVFRFSAITGGPCNRWQRSRFCRWPDPQPCSRPCRWQSPAAHHRLPGGGWISRSCWGTRAGRHSARDDP